MAQHAVLVIGGGKGAGIEKGREGGYWRGGPIVRSIVSISNFLSLRERMKKIFA